MIDFSRFSIKNSKIFQSEDSKFGISCGLKFVSIYLIVFLFNYYIAWTILTLNNIYFEANGYLTGNDFEEAFFDNAISFLFENAAYAVLFLIFLFFAGVHVSKILLRPFEIMSEFCLARVNGEKVSYNPDLFSDYKLLTRFSDFFFRFTEDGIRNKNIQPNTIPSDFSKVRAPQFEKVFFFHFMLLVSIIAIVNIMFVTYISTNIQEKIVDLALIALKNNSEVGYFLNNQTRVFQSVSLFTVFIVIISYITLAFHLYSKVSGAVFGVFATMRSFMKGNFSARVHLIGYAQIRPHSRALNKYLDYVERECSKDENQVES